MKKLVNQCKFILISIASFLLLQGCLKDTATRTYTIYSPVYKSVTEVRASIKSDLPSPIAKPGKIVVLGNYIFLNEIDKGVHIIDNTNPSAPINKYFISIPGNIDLAVKDSTLYADLYRDMVTIDISNPSAIAVKKIVKNVFPFRYYSNFSNADTNNIIVDWIKKDTTVNANEKSSIYLADRYLLMSSMARAVVPSAVGVAGSMARFAVLNNYLYAVTESNLYTFDISEPHNPVLASEKNVGWQIETIFPFRENLFIGSRTGVYIFNTTNPAQPKQVSMFGHITLCDPVIADDNYAFVTLRGGTTCGGSLNQLDILDISNLSSPKNIKSYPLANPKGLSKDGNLLFVCDGEAGLKVFDVSDVKNMKLLQNITGINSYDVIAINHIALVVATDGLYQYDYTNNTQVILKSKITYKM